jgi:hypothetical protein
MQTGSYVTFVEGRKLVEKESVYCYICSMCLVVETQRALEEILEQI